MRIYSIFPSIDGEVNASYQGRLSTFIRLCGCNLRCNYCDTRYALEDSKAIEVSIDDIIDKVLSLPPRKVTITGGEPLLQADELYILINKLLNAGYDVSVETNGSLPIVNSRYFNGLREGVSFCWVVDYKLPSSGQEHEMKFLNYIQLTKNDFVKFVIQTEEDLKVAINVQRLIQSSNFLSPIFAYSPVINTKGKLSISVSRIMEVLMSEGTGREIVNIQLHKLVPIGINGKWEEDIEEKYRELLKSPRDSFFTLQMY